MSKNDKNNLSPSSIPTVKNVVTKGADGTSHCTTLATFGDGHVAVHQSSTNSATALLYTPNTSVYGATSARTIVNESNIHERLATLKETLIDILTTHLPQEHKTLIGGITIYSDSIFVKINNSMTCHLMFDPSYPADPDEAILSLEYGVVYLDDQKNSNCTPTIFIDTFEAVVLFERIIKDFLKSKE